METESINTGTPETPVNPDPGGTGIALFAPREPGEVEDSSVVPVPDSGPQITSDELLLNLTHDFSPFNVPKLEEVISQVQLAFPDDTGITLQTMRGRGTGLYKLILSTPIGDLTNHSVTFTRPNKEGVNVDLAVTLTHILPEPSRAPMQRREGVLVTIVNARVGVARSMNNAQFDEVLKEHGELIKMTEHQLYKGTQMTNGNRYAVIDPQGRGTIPGSIYVNNTVLNRTLQFYIRYKGQQWHCRRCDEMHCGPCPVIAEFNAAKKAREKLTVTTKIYADSSLRHADTVGLKADVICMSGAGFGELANAIHDDPDETDSKNHLFVVGGKSNEVKGYNYPDFPTFATGVYAGLQKLVRELRSSPDKHLTIVSISEPPEDLVFDERVKDLCVSIMLEKLQGEPQISQILLTPAEVAKDPSGHPSLEGTRSVLNAMEQYMLDHTEDTLIFNEKFCVNSRYYMGVEPIFKYGCKNCDSFGQFPETGGLCPACVLQWEPPDFEELFAQCTAVAPHFAPDFDGIFPPLPSHGGPPTDGGASEASSESTGSESTVVNGEPPASEGTVEDGEIVEVVESEVDESLQESVAEGGIAITVPSETSLPSASVPPKRSLNGDDVEGDENLVRKVIKTDLHVHDNSMSDS